MMNGRLHDMTQNGMLLDVSISQRTNVASNFNRLLKGRRFTASDYPFGILDLRLLITPLVS